MRPKHWIDPTELITKIKALGLQDVTLRVNPTTQAQEIVVAEVGYVIQLQPTLSLRLEGTCSDDLKWALWAIQRLVHSDDALSEKTLPTL